MSQKEVKRVWKPLCIDGLRLYRVLVVIPMRHDTNNVSLVKIVAAKSPTHAERLMREIYKDEYTSIIGDALDIYQPESWYEKGIILNGGSDDSTQTL